MKFALLGNVPRMQVSGNQWMRAPKPLSKRPPRANVALITPPSAPRIEIWDVSALLLQITISESEVSSDEIALLSMRGAIDLLLQLL